MAMYRARRSKRLKLEDKPSPVAAGSPMADECDTSSGTDAKDWASAWRTLAAFWGLPGAAMLAASLLDPLSRAVIWIAMLVWMGVACFLNARRCSRTHCRITAPFFLVMAAFVGGYAAGMLPFGRHGWSILGGVSLSGFVLLWWGSEYAWGRFSSAKNSAPSRNSKLS
jgi:hypothetical protein